MRNEFAKNLYRRFGARNAAHFVRLVIERGYLDVNPTSASPPRLRNLIYAIEAAVRRELEEGLPPV